jgi:hypothetical protein
LGGSGLRTQIPTNWSDFIPPILGGLMDRQEPDRYEPDRFALGTRRPLIEET